MYHVISEIHDRAPVYVVENSETHERKPIRFEIDRIAQRYADYLNKTNNPPSVD